MCCVHASHAIASRTSRAAMNFVFVFRASRFGFPLLLLASAVIPFAQRLFGSKVAYYALDDRPGFDQCQQI
jgi:hypothetical protein